MAAIESPVAPTAPAATRPQDSVSAWMAGNTEIEATLPAAPPTPAPASPEPAKPSIEPAKPQTPEPAKPAATVNPDEEDENGEKWPRKAADWKKFTDKRKEEKLAYEKQVAEQAARIKEYEDKLSKIGDPSEALTLKERLAQKEKEAQDYEQRLRTVAVEQHPKFKAYFDSKINPRIDLAKEIVGGEHADKMAELLKSPKSPYRDQQIREIAGQLEDYDRARLGALQNELDSVYAERNSEIAKANENYQNMTKAEQERAKADQEKRVKDFENGFKSTVAKATDPKDGLFLFQKREGDEAWNQQVDKRLEAAKNLIYSNNATPETISQAALYAVALPDILKAYIDRESTITKLEAQVKELSAANPSLAGGGAASDGGGDGSSPIDAIKPGARPMDAMKGFMTNLIKDMQR